MNTYFETSRLKVRRACERDVEVLLRLVEEFMPAEASKNGRLRVLKSALENPDYDLWVAEINGKIVGFIDQWVIHDFAHGANLSFIQNLYVTPKHRRKGVGERLLQQIIKSTEDKKVKEIHVWTKFENKPAINLYKKHGLVGEHLLLEKELNY